VFDKTGTREFGGKPITACQGQGRANPGKRRCAPGGISGEHDAPRSTRYCGKLENSLNFPALSKLDFAHRTPLFCCGNLRQSPSICSLSNNGWIRKVMMMAN
jgi:hypothetical protein